MVYQLYSTSRRSFQVTFLLDVYFRNFITKFLSLILHNFRTDEWNNFMERINCKRESEVWGNEENVLQLRHWASLRGQTLCRTGTSAIPIDLIKYGSFG